MRIVDTAPGTTAWRRWIQPLVDQPPAELWADGAHDLTALPPAIIVWAAVEERVLALASAWPGDEVWCCGLNAEIGWRDRAERYWPLCHAARQDWLIEQRIRRATTWLHDEPPPAAPGTADVVRIHLETGWTFTGREGPSPDGPHYARELGF